MNDKQLHETLYNQIPSFQCKPGCTDCCGIVPLSDYEARQLMAHSGVDGELLDILVTRTDDKLKCIFATEHGCDVYEQRPLMCRLFGAVAVPMLTCPHGCGPFAPLSETQVDDILAAYSKGVTLR